MTICQNSQKIYTFDKIQLKIYRKCSLPETDHVSLVAPNARHFTRRTVTNHELLYLDKRTIFRLCLLNKLIDWEFGPTKGADLTKSLIFIEIDWNIFYLVNIQNCDDARKLLYNFIMLFCFFGGYLFVLFVLFMFTNLDNCWKIITNFIQ